MKIYGTIKEVSEIFGMKPAKVRDFCHADGQKFASQKVERGNILINIPLFEKWMTARRPEYLRRI